MGILKGSKKLSRKVKLKSLLEKQSPIPGIFQEVPHAPEPIHSHHQLIKDQHYKPGKRLQIGKIKEWTPAPEEFVEEASSEKEKNKEPDKATRKKPDYSSLNREMALLKSQQRQDIEKEIQVYKQTAFQTIDQEKQDILDNAHSEGYESGKKEGEALLKEKVEEMLGTINAALKEKKALLVDAKKDVLELAIKTAERIIETEITTNQDVLYNIIAEALNKITDKDRVIIKINTKDAEYVRINLEKFKALMPDIKNLEIQEDANIDQGGCIIETQLGYIDSSVKTKLESIRQALFSIYQDEKEQSAPQSTDDEQS